MQRAVSVIIGIIILILFLKLMYFGGIALIVFLVGYAIYKLFKFIWNIPLP
jgi:hypothetical protein